MPAPSIIRPRTEARPRRKEFAAREELTNPGPLQKPFFQDDSEGLRTTPQPAYNHEEFGRISDQATTVMSLRLRIDNLERQLECSSFFGKPSMEEPIEEACAAYRPVFTPTSEPPKSPNKPPHLKGKRGGKLHATMENEIAARR